MSWLWQTVFRAKRDRCREFGKHTIKQLAERYQVSSRTIHSKLGSKIIISKDKEVIVFMDTLVL